MSKFVLEFESINEFINFFIKTYLNLTFLFFFLKFLHSLPTPTLFVHLWNLTPSRRTKSIGAVEKHQKVVAAVDRTCPLRASLKYVTLG